MKATHANPLLLAFSFIVFTFGVLFIPQEVRADQLDYSSVSSDPANTSNYYMEVLAGGATGTFDSFTIKPSDAVGMSTTGWTSGFFTFTQCDSLASEDATTVNVNAEGTGNCIGRVRHQVDSVSVVGSDLVFHWNTPITLDGSKRYIMAGYFGGNVAGNVYYGTVSGSYQGHYVDNTIKRTYYTAPGLVEPGDTPPITDTSTRIEWVNPPITSPSATTSSSTVNFQFKYYLNSNDSDIATFTHILLQLYPLSYPNDPTQRVDVLTPLVPDSLEDVNITITTNKLGYYLGLVSFWNGVEESTTCQWWQFGCEETHPVVGATFKNNFNIATTTIPADAPPFIVQGFDSICNGIDSSFFGIDTVMCKTLGFLFTPNPDTITNMTNGLTGLLKTKQPFAGFYAAENRFTGLTSETGTTPGDINVDLGAGTFIPAGAFAIFSWEGARNFIGVIVHEDLGNVLIGVEYIMFLIFAWVQLTRERKV